MRRKRSVMGFTAVDLLVIAFLLALLTALAAIFLVGCGRTKGTRKVAKRLWCASNMRQIGLAVFQYEKDFVCMPNAQWNAFRQIGGYLGTTAGTVSGPTDEKATAVYRCPSDEYLDDRVLWNTLSYAPIVDSGYLDGNDDDTPDGNFTYCAWSYCKFGYGAEGENAAIWQERNLTQIAPDTAILVECWDVSNRLNLDQETPPGYLLFDYAGDAGGDGSKTGMGTLNFTGPACAGTIKSVGDVGGYAFLSTFGYEAREVGKSRDLADLLHDGRMNVLYADGSVLASALKDITNKSPVNIPQWTRTVD